MPWSTLFPRGTASKFCLFMDLHMRPASMSTLMTWLVGNLACPVSIETGEESSGITYLYIENERTRFLSSGPGDMMMPDCPRIAVIDCIVDLYIVNSSLKSVVSMVIIDQYAGIQLYINGEGLTGSASLSLPHVWYSSRELASSCSTSSQQVLVTVSWRYGRV